MSTFLRIVIHVISKFVPFLKASHVLKEAYETDSLSWLTVNSEISWLSDEDHKFWWQTSGYALATLLQNSGYPAERQYKALSFFGRVVAPNLGQAPSTRNSSLLSFMTDNGIPIELSWDWGIGNQSPKIRYAVEPYHQSCSSKSNQQAGLEFGHLLLSELPDTKLEWYEHFQGQFHCIISDDDDFRLEGHRSRIFYAFDLNRNNIISKAYFFPAFKARASCRSTWSIILEAIQNAPYCTVEALRALDVFEEFTSQQYDKALEFEMLAIDLIDPLDSRLKVYFRSRETSFASAIHIITLGGLIKNQKLDQGTKNLKLLWDFVFDIGDSQYDDELPATSHRTSGILYYVDFRLGDVFPKIKIYLPVRHYCSNDNSIIHGLQKYFEHRGRNDYLHLYKSSLSSLIPEKILETEAGTQTYIGCSFCDDGELRIISYLNLNPLDIRLGKGMASF